MRTAFKLVTCGLLFVSMSLRVNATLGQVAADENDPAGPRRILTGLDIAAVAADPIRPRIYAADQTGDSLLILSTVTDTITSRILLNDQPEDLAVDQTGSAVYVRLRESPRVDVVDLATQQLVTPIPLPGRAGAFAVGPGRLYAVVGEFFQPTLVAIDLSTGAQVGSLGLQSIMMSMPSEMAISPSGSDLILVSSGSPVTTARVTISGNTLALAWSCRDYTGIMGGRGLVISADATEVFSTMHDGSAGPLKVLGLTACSTTLRNLPTPGWTHALGAALAQDRILLGVDKTLVAVRASTAATLGAVGLPEPSVYRSVTRILAVPGGDSVYAMTSTHPLAVPDDLWVIRPSFAGSSVGTELTSAQPGQQVPIAVAVADAGYWLDQTVYATVTLPAGFTVATGSLSAGSYDPARNEIHWSGMYTGATQTISATVQAPAGFGTGSRAVAQLLVTGGGQRGTVVRPFVVWNPHRLLLPVVRR